MFCRFWLILFCSNSCLLFYFSDSFVFSLCESRFISLLWEKIFYIFFGFSRCCFMLLYKTFRNLYKTKYFLYKNRRKFRHVFSAFSGSFYADCGFFCFFLLTFPVEKSVFLTRPSVNDRIYSYRPYIFHAFFGWFDKFFSFFSRAFLHFSVRLRKNLLLFPSGSSVFWDFFASSE